MYWRKRQGIEEETLWSEGLECFWTKDNSDNLIHWRRRIYANKCFYSHHSSSFWNNIHHRRIWLSIHLVNWEWPASEAILRDRNEYSRTVFALWHSWWIVFRWWFLLCFDNNGRNFEHLFLIYGSQLLRNS